MNISTINVEFDHPFTISDAGKAEGLPTVRAQYIHAPSVWNDPADDIMIDSPEWHALTGYTGQYGYHGAVMHPSEYLGGGIVRDMADREMYPEGTVFVCVVVNSEDESEDEPVGWAILEYVGEF